MPPVLITGMYEQVMEFAGEYCREMMSVRANLEMFSKT